MEEGPRSDQSVRRLEVLAEIIPKYEKTPPKYKTAFHQAVVDCLQDGELVVVKAGVKAATKVCGCFHCREALVAFEFRHGRLPASKRTAALDKAAALVHMALLEMDLAGYFEFLAENDIRYRKRDAEQKVVFLRQQYWAHHGTGREAQWVVKELGLLSHPQAGEALKVIQKETERITKDDTSWAAGEFRGLVEAAIQLSGFMVKTGSPAKGLERALQEGDWKLCIWAAREAERLGVEKGAPVLKAALLHRRAAYKKEKKRIHWRIRDVLLDRLETLGVEVGEKEAKWGPPRLRGH